MAFHAFKVWLAMTKVEAEFSTLAAMPGVDTGGVVWMQASGVVLSPVMATMLGGTKYQRAFQGNRIRAS